MDNSLLIHSFTKRHLGYIPSLGNYEYSCYKHPSAGFCVDISLQFLWADNKECDCWIV